MRTKPDFSTFWVAFWVTLAHQLLDCFAQSGLPGSEGGQLDTQSGQTCLIPYQVGASSLGKMLKIDQRLTWILQKCCQKGVQTVRTNRIRIQGNKRKCVIQLGGAWTWRTGPKCTPKLDSKEIGWCMNARGEPLKKRAGGGVKKLLWCIYGSPFGSPSGGASSKVWLWFYR